MDTFISTLATNKKLPHLPIELIYKIYDLTDIKLYIKNNPHPIYILYKTIDVNTCYQINNIIDSYTKNRFRSKFISDEAFDYYYCDIFKWTWRIGVLINKN